MRIDPQLNKQTQRIPVGNGPSGIAISPGAVWVTNRLDDTVTKIDSKSGKVLRAQLNAGASPSDIAYGLGALWIANESTSTVTRIDPRTGGLQEFNVGNGPEAVAIGSGSVWVANSLDGTISRIDPRTSVVTTRMVGQGPSSVLASDGAIWVADSYGGRIVRIDSASMDVVRTIAVGSGPQGLASLGGRVWLSARETAPCPPWGHPAAVRAERSGLSRRGTRLRRRLVGVVGQRRRTRRVQARGGRGRWHVGSRPCDVATGAHRRWANVHVPASAGHPLLERRAAACERFSARDSSACFAWAG